MRIPAVLATALLVLGSTKGLFGTSQCAQHDLLGGASGHAQAPAGDHQHHAAQDLQQDEEQVACTCLDHCSACPAGALPGLRGYVIAATFAELGTRTAVAVSRFAGRTPHQLPFATAPPAIA